MGIWSGAIVQRYFVLDLLLWAIMARSLGRFFDGIKSLRDIRLIYKPTDTETSKYAED